MYLPRGDSYEQDVIILGWRGRGETGSGSG